jgi:ribonuclease HI
MTNSITIYADCASYHNGKPDQIGGFCMLAVNENYEIEHRIMKAFNNSTNNFNELMGLLAGIEYILNERPEINIIRVVSDSEYCILGAKERVFKWKAKGWRNSSGEVKNLDLWKAMVEFITYANRNRKVLKFEWIKGHKGKNITLEDDPDTYFQELCDTYATKMLSKVVANRK